MSVLIPVAVGTAAVVVFLVSRIITTHRQDVQTGSESMLGTKAEAKEVFRAEGDRYRGRVLLRGEWWNAVSDSPIAIGDTVQISDRDGLTLFVQTDGGKLTGEDASTTENAKAT